MNLAQYELNTNFTYDAYVYFSNIKRIQYVFVNETLVKVTSNHYNDVIMSAIASQITSLTIVYSTVYSDADQRKHQSSASLAFVWWIHRGPMNSPHKWPVTWKMFPFDDDIMITQISDGIFNCPGHMELKWISYDFIQSRTYFVCGVYEVGPIFEIFDMKFKRISYVYVVYL